MSRRQMAFSLLPLNESNSLTWKTRTTEKSASEGRYSSFSHSICERSDFVIAVLGNMVLSSPERYSSLLDRCFHKL